MSSLKNIAYFPESQDKGECLLIGPGNHLVEPGIYQASYLHFETCGMYGKKISKDKTKLSGGKLYLWFWIDPFAEKLSMGDKVELYAPYNASAVLHPIGIGGRFEMSRKRNYSKDFDRLFSIQRRDRISPGAFKNKLFDVRVGSVETNDKQRKHSKENRYSVIREIIGFTS